MNSVHSLTTNDNSQLLSVGQAAKTLGVSTKTLRRWDDKGILPSQRSKGGQRRYTKQQLKEFGAKQSLIKAYIRQRLGPSLSQRIGEQKITKPSWQTSFEAYPQPEKKSKPIFKGLGIALTVLVILATLALIGKSLISSLEEKEPVIEIAESLHLESETQETPLKAELEIEGMVKAKGFCIEDICLTKEQLEKILDTLE